MERILEMIRMMAARAWDRAHPRCPGCGGQPDSYYDPETGQLIYVCRKCYREWTTNCKEQK